MQGYWEEGYPDFKLTICFPTENRNELKVQEFDKMCIVVHTYAYDIFFHVKFTNVQIVVRYTLTCMHFDLSFFILLFFFFFSFSLWYNLIWQGVKNQQSTILFLFISGFFNAFSLCNGVQVVVCITWNWLTCHDAAVNNYLRLYWCTVNRIISPWYDLLG